jgi:sugar/nucleoside kinase (ribokinase family)
VSAVDLVAVGDVLLDVVTSELAEHPRHARVEVRAGGSAVNAARTALAAGRSSLVVGCIGDDHVGRLVVEQLAAEGVDARLTLVGGARTGRAVVAGGRVVAERGANSAFAPEHLPIDLVARAVLVSGYQLFRDDSGAGAEAALALPAEWVGVDLGSAGLVRSYGADRARRLVATADVVFGDEEAVAVLEELEGPVLVTTLGPGGARAGDVRVPSATVVDAKPLGAGDALAAATLLALSDGAVLRDALAAGVAAGTGVAIRSRE